MKGLIFFQKIALDKLATRVHSMYGKVFDAAMLSVQPQNLDMGRKETTMFSAFDSKLTWVKVFRIIPEFRILRLTFHRKSASKY